MSGSNDRSLKLGLVGVGPWGLRYLSTISGMSGADIVRVAGRRHQAESLKNFSNISFTHNWQDLLTDSALNGIIVATSPESHYPITKAALEHNIPVLVEKPFTLSAQLTNELCLLSERFGTLCMINYVHLYSGGYRDLKLKLASAGPVTKIVSENFACGPFRVNTPVLWDWGCHDLAMCLDLLKKEPYSIAITQLKNPNVSPLAEIFCLKMFFRPDVEARCIFGNAAEFKRRDFSIYTEKNLLTYDGLSEGLSKSYSTDDMFSLERFVKTASPLESTVNEFLLAIRQNLSSHYTLSLAKWVNGILAELEKKLIN